MLTVLFIPVNLYLIAIGGGFKNMIEYLKKLRIFYCNKQSLCDGCYWEYINNFHEDFCILDNVIDFIESKMKKK